MSTALVPREISSLTHEVVACNAKGRKYEAEASPAFSRAEDMYKRAGIVLAEAKVIAVAQGLLIKTVIAECGLSQEWADTLVRLGRNETTLAEVRFGTAQRVIEHRKKASVTVTLPQNQLLSRFKKLADKMTPATRQRAVNYLTELEVQDD